MRPRLLALTDRSFGVGYCRFNGLGSLQYNFYVLPPNGTEYTVLVTPTWQSSVILTTLPIGISSIRAVAIDITYVHRELARSRVSDELHREHG